MGEQIGPGDLDEFQLVRPLGKGGMGEVYLGHDTVLDRAVAIKLIGSRSPDAGSRERFLIEARAIARLSHPNVVTIFRVGATADGRPFLVQELIRGRSLDRVPRPMPWRTVCELGVGIARGLDAAHRRGILHRDVKPANVMLDENGTARLLDFGLAKLGEVGARPLPVAHTGEEIGVATTRAAAGADVAETRDVTPSPAVAARSSTTAPVVHTVPGSVIGTPRYTAPENWRGELSTERSDLYSLGALLYELLTGVAPYPETELAELERAVLAGGVRPVLELAPDTHATFAELVTGCLASDPAERPASAAELAHALEGVLVDAPSVPEGNPYRGLRAFDAAHRGLFFGRGADVSALVDRLRTEPLVVVVGDSGIGKSSVCHAGVVPAVVANALGDGRTWRAVTVALGGTPWTALCDALGVPTSTDARTLRQPPDTGLLLVVDQLEELVTLGDPAEAAKVAELLASIAGGVPGVKALLAVRGDFLTRVAALPALAQPMTRGLHLLRVLSRDDLHEAIVGPARTKGVRYETDAMVDELVAAVGHNPGALPLLQFTLAELWQSREGGVIPARALAALGGVDGALAGHADRVLLGLGAPERAAARRIVMRLVSDARTRAVRPRDELAAADDETAMLAIESLVRGRLVVARDTVAGTPSYELAHEALIRSWHTLRDWLDEAAGEHAARNRLIASASEWHRLERKPDLLWSRRQLDELRTVDDVSPTERAFVDASRAQLRRRRIMRIAAIAAAPLLAVAIYTGVRFEAARRRDREVGARVANATELRTLGDRLASEVARLRTVAFGQFEADRTSDGEVTWTIVQGFHRAADAAYRRATGELEGAFFLEPNAVRAPMARTLWAHAELVEAMNDHDLARQLVIRLAAYDRKLSERWDVPGHVVVSSDAAATLSLHASSSTGTLAGRFDATPLAAGDRLDIALPAGSYLVIARTATGEEARFPILLGRGESLAETIAIPRAPRAGFAFVPAGRFLIGTDHHDRRIYQRTSPLHSSHTGSYWISLTEVTFGEWIEFLRALSPEERAPRLPDSPGRERSVRLLEVDHRFVLQFDPHRTLLTATEGQPLIYTERRNTAVRWDRLPVVGVTFTASAAYAAWLDRTGRVPGARLCTVREWERAARGADGRSFPHGNTLEPYQANHDVTYKRVGFGLDEVGSFPASDSPFGIHDLAGNASELVVLPGELGMKGGSYFHTALTAMSSNNSPATANLSLNYMGFRLCADAAR